MKSKSLALIGLCALSFSTNEILAIHQEKAPIIIEVANVPNGFDIIDLIGNLMNNVGPNAIEAGFNDNSVYIQFNQSFGNVSISLYNSIEGLVYSDTVNTDVQQLVIIPIGNEVSGIYTLELNSINGSAEGDFEHNNN